MNTTTKNHKPINITIIDDDTVVLFIYEKIIKTSGIPCNITSFSGAISAIDELKKINSSSSVPQPDLIFVDINMPVMNGWEFIEQYSKIAHDNGHRKNVICMSTSSIDEFDKKMCERYEAVDEYVIKPLTLASFKELIGKYFNTAGELNT